MPTLLWILWIWYITKRLCRYNGYRPQDIEMVLNYLCGPNLITWTLKSRKISSAGMRNVAQREVREIPNMRRIPHSISGSAVDGQPSVRCRGKPLSEDWAPVDSQKGSRNLSPTTNKRPLNSTSKSNDLGFFPGPNAWFQSYEIRSRETF